MRVVVFGGAGFIGSHVADALTDAGHDVVIFDLSSSPYLLPSQRMIVGNILDKGAVADAVQGCDYVYNFAGIADLDDASTRPLDTAQQNVVGTIFILEAARKAAVKRFVYASTIYVYSNKGGFYRCSKQAAELYVEEYARKYGLDYTILRYGTVYGPRADHRNSMYRYLKQAIDNGKIVCDTTGDEMREYIHVKDAAQLSVSILDAEYSRQPVIITGHHPMRFRDMLHMVKEILGNQVVIELQGRKSDEDAVHYNLTPYSFVPKSGRKLTSNQYVDMGQGLLECITEIHTENVSRDANKD